MILGQFTLIRLRAQLRKSWAEPEPELELSLQHEQGSARIFSAGLEYMIQAAGVHISGSARARLGIRAEPV